MTKNIVENHRIEEIPGEMSEESIRAEVERLARCRCRYRASGNVIDCLVPPIHALVYDLIGHPTAKAAVVFPSESAEGDHELDITFYDGEIRVEAVPDWVAD